VLNIGILLQHIQRWSWKWCELVYYLAKERLVFFCNWTGVQQLGLLDPEDQGTMII
jgi:hypothetical protein